MSRTDRNITMTEHKGECKGNRQFTVHMFIQQVYITEIQTEG